ncbi:MAG: hypothetical protein L0Z55_12845 [Planctomycetes bacterium]|nr:hypothetical protein [Planctomycetota bacterium]
MTDRAIDKSRVDDTDLRARRFQSGLRSQREIYLALAEISRRQEQVLREGGTEEILQLARSKQAEMGRIESVEREIAPLKQEWPLFRERVSPKLRAEIEEDLCAIQSVLQRLIQIEARGGPQFDALRRDTAEKLKQVEGGRRIQQAYVRAPRPTNARYLDRTE